jgi:hypothetical protein
VVPPRFKRVDQAPHGTAAPHLKRFAAEKRPFPARGDTQGAMTASIVLSRRCKMTVCNVLISSKRSEQGIVID